MKLIVITAEQNINNEAAILNKLLQNGLLLLHIRKPEYTATEMAHLLEKILPEFHSRIVLHSHFTLLNQFALKGIHLNKRNPEFKNNSNCSVSISCHSVEEIAQKANKYDYLFLSPIFNSISKENYTSKFSTTELMQAKQEGIINNKIIALGGINASNISTVKNYGFGGAAVLGAIWNTASENQIINTYNKLKTEI